MIPTLPVLAYQLFFVAVIFFASRLGRKPLTITMIICLLWTTTHLFFVPLAILQAAVIVASYLLFRNRPRPERRSIDK